MSETTRIVVFFACMVLTTIGLFAITRTVTKKVKPSTVYNKKEHSRIYLENKNNYPLTMTVYKEKRIMTEQRIPPGGAIETQLIDGINEHFSITFTKP